MQIQPMNVAENNPHQKQSNTAFIIVILTALLGLMSADIYLPVIPVIERALHTTANNMQASVSLFMLGLSVAGLLLIPLSDRFGRRAIMLIASGAACIGCLTIILSHSIVGFICGRLLQGIGATNGLILARAILKDIYPDKQKLAKKASWYAAALAVAPAMSPLLGAYITHLSSWRVIFVFLLSSYAILWLIQWKAFPETLKEKTTNGSFFPQLLTNSMQVIRNRYFISLSLMSSLAYGGYIAYLTAAPYIFHKQFLVSSIVNGWLMASLVIGAISSRLLNTWLIPKLGLEKIIKLGLTVLCAAGCSYLFLYYLHIRTIWSVLCPAILYTFAIGTMFACLLSLALNKLGHMAGLAAGLYGCMQILGATCGSGIVAIHSGNQIALIGWMLMIIAILMLVLYQIYRIK